MRLMSAPAVMHSWTDWSCATASDPVSCRARRWPAYWASRSVRPAVIWASSASAGGLALRCERPAGGVPAAHVRDLGQHLLISMACLHLATIERVFDPIGRGGTADLHAGRLRSAGLRRSCQGPATAGPALRATARDGSEMGAAIRCQPRPSDPPDLRKPPGPAWLIRRSLSCGLGCRGLKSHLNRTAMVAYNTPPEGW